MTHRRLQLDRQRLDALLPLLRSHGRFIDQEAVDLDHVDGLAR